MKVISIKNLFLVFSLLLSACQLTAQNRDRATLKGSVTNKNGNPIINASIALKGTQFGSLSNKNGEFEFKAPAGNYTLSVSSVGYEQQEQSITLYPGKTSELVLILANRIENLHEVVVESTYFQEVLSKATTATKSDLKLMDTPAPIVVVGEKLLTDQSATTIQESVRNISGITQAGNNYGIGDNMIIRGLGVNYAYDGMYGGGDLGNTYNPTRTLANIERIEVLKGPATGLYGTGAAGGVFNMIEKKPLEHQQILATFQMGKWDFYRGMLDVSLPISKKTGFRLVGAKEYTSGFRAIERAVNEVHASLKHQVAHNNTFLISSSFISDKNQVESVGYPVRILNQESLANPNLDPTWDNLVNDTDADGDKALGIQLTDEQRQILANSITQNEGVYPFDLNGGSLVSPISTPNKGKEIRVKARNDWSFGQNTVLTQQLMYRNYKSDYTRQTGAYNYIYWNRNGEINAVPRAPLVVDGTIFPYAARRQEYRSQESNEKAIQYFADLKSGWSANKIKGEHLVSYNYQARKAELMSWSIWDADGTAKGKNPVPYIFDIRNPNWPTGSFWDYSPSLRSNYDKTVNNYGFSAQEVVTVWGKLTGRFGAAYSKTKQIYTQKGTDSNPATPLQSTDDAGFTYNLGLNYRIFNDLSAYVNLSKGRMAYSFLGSVTGEDDRPDSESKSFDAGLRYSFMGRKSKLYVSAVYFNTARTNLRYTNPLYNDNQNDPSYNVTVPQYFYDDEDSSEGVEVDVNLVLNKNWSLNTNGTFQEAVLVRSGATSTQVKGVPKQFLSAWAEYRLFLGTQANPIRFNLGYKFTSERTINSIAFGLPSSYLPEYSIWEAAVSFRYKNWDVRCNIDNLFNTKYFSKALFLGGLPGSSRNAKLSLRYTL